MSHGALGASLALLPRNRDNKDRRIGMPHHFFRSVPNYRNVQELPVFGRKRDDVDVVLSCYEQDLFCWVSLPNHLNYFALASEIRRNQIAELIHSDVWVKAYHVTISATGFVNWTSSAIILNPGQIVFLTDSRHEIAGGVTSVTVYSSSEQIAVEQVKLEEKQRVFGIIPNFYVVYDPNPAPLTTRLKFSLALKAATDPVTFMGDGYLLD
jgi:hypothetical protein